MLSGNAIADNEMVRLAAIQTLGYLCEDMEPEFLTEKDINLILGAVLSNFDMNESVLTKHAVKAFAKVAIVSDKSFH